MDKKQIFNLEYGIAKNGGIGYFLPELNCFLLDWKGDLLPEEFSEVLDTAIKEVEKLKCTSWIGDTSKLGPTTEEHDKYIQEVWTPRVVAIGVKKLAVVLPNDIVGEFTIQEIMENINNTTKENQFDFESAYFKSLDEAVDWIKS